jgi:prophage antirepressor-like protein
MSDLIPFDFEGAAVRVVLRGGEPWFVLADVCLVLSVGNSRDAARRLDDDEKGVDTIDTPGGSQQMVVINEAGLYSLILTSRKAEARKFKKWVVGEVLPSIRRTGGYGSPAADPLAALRDPDTLRGLLLDYSGRVKALESEKAALEPKADALDRIAAADGALSITAAAKALQIRPKDLFTYLHANGWIYRRAGGGGYLGYQSKTTQGLLEHRVTTLIRSDGTEKIVEQVLVTAKGMTTLAMLLNELTKHGAFRGGKLALAH